MTRGCSRAQPPPRLAECDRRSEPSAPAWPRQRPQRLPRSRSRARCVSRSLLNRNLRSPSTRGSSTARLCRTHCTLRLHAHAALHGSTQCVCAHSWDDDWDFRKPTAERKEKHGSGAVRHIILVRHGQYEESSHEDAKRVLTPLGRDQAEATGVRLAAILAAAAKNGEVKVRLHCSTLTRAVETAQIVGRHLPPSVTRVDNDPNLAEGYPAPPLPNPRFTEKVHRDSARIEAAFRSLFYRAHPPKPTRAEKCGDAADGPLATQSAPAAPSASPSPPHEYEIVICHGNVIRYFAMRALQLPPEAWLRLCTFNCSLTYLTVRPSGSVSLRLLGDTGHLPMELTTFSMHHGYDW